MIKGNSMLAKTWVIIKGSGILAKRGRGRVIYNLGS
jgi:hypothetical protein